MIIHISIVLIAKSEFFCKHLLKYLRAICLTKTTTLIFVYGLIKKFFKLVTEKFISGDRAREF